MQKYVDVHTSLDYSPQRQVIEQPTSSATSLGTHFVCFMEYIGICLFSVVGTQVSGNAGYNIVGCALVGCVAGMGGRTINNLLHGSSSLLRQLPGVFGARNPLPLAMALGSSSVTFFAWPLYCENKTEFYLETVIGKNNLEDDGSVVEDAFVETCARDQDFLNTIRIWVSSQMKTSASKEMTARELFHRLDLDNSGTICREEMMMLVQERIRNSWEMYAIDTVALASISVAGVHGAIAMGLHPLVAHLVSQCRWVAFFVIYFVVET